MKVCLSCRTPLAGGDWRCCQCGFTPEFRNDIPYFAPHLSVEADSYPVEAHEILAQLEQKSFWFTNRNHLLSMAIARFFPAARNMFEVGCGTGCVLQHLSTVRPEMKLTGGELYEAGLQVARKRLPAIEFVQVDALRMPYVEEFDLVGAFDVLEHIEDDAGVLAGIHKSLAPGGGLLLTVPQHPWLWCAWDDYSGHKRRYRREQLAAKVHEAGFTIRWMNSFLSLLLPTMLAARLRFLLPGAGRAKQDPFAELRLPRPLNSFLEKVCAVERTFIRLGMPLPFGGSLICAAVKG